MLARPWQKKQENLLNELLTREQLPHALLFYGEDGLGVESLLESFANNLWRKLDNSTSNCKDHPDCYWFNANEKEVLIDNVRELQSNLFMTAKLANGKLVIIEGIDKVNERASNSLLKLLEEPPKDTLFIFSSPGLATLLPTIASRCFKVPFFPASIQQSKEYFLENDYDLSLLPLVKGRPLLAEQWLRGTKKDHFTTLQTHFLKLIRSGGSFFDLKKNFDDLELEETFFVLEYLLTFWVKAIIFDKSLLKSTNLSLEGKLECFSVLDELLRQKAFFLNKQAINKERLLEVCFLSMDNVWSMDE